MGSLEGRVSALRFPRAFERRRRLNLICHSIERCYFIIYIVPIFNAGKNILGVIPYSRTPERDWNCKNRSNIFVVINTLL